MNDTRGFARPDRPARRGRFLGCRGVVWLAALAIGVLLPGGGEDGSAQAARHGGRCCLKSRDAPGRHCRLRLRKKIACVKVSGQADAAKPPAAEKPAASDPYAWKSLFDGKTLGQWKVPVFGGDGEVVVKDGIIELGMGATLTGITWSGELPGTNYELTLEGKRLEGNDFFATTTFPVGDRCCSLVVGGWGGTIVGISNVDYYDASDNITTKFRSFDNNRWYRIRIQVTDARIEAWIDDEQVVDLPRAGHKFDVRIEVDLCKPLGVSSWCTKAALRDLRLRQLTPEEVAAAASKEPTP